MARDRNEILQEFLKNEKLLELLEVGALDAVDNSFKDKSKYLLVEAIKKMILSYSTEDSTSQTLKKINALISTEVRSS
ncbi:MAG: hypothetical protein HRU04_05545 [Oceanospirillaceae bacterium]|nr:hypothetical protein [Oceanospirillaceae bacterium]